MLCVRENPIAANCFTGSASSSTAGVRVPGKGDSGNGERRPCWGGILKGAWDCCPFFSSLSFDLSFLPKGKRILRLCFCDSALLSGVDVFEPERIFSRGEEARGGGDDDLGAAVERTLRACGETDRGGGEVDWVLEGELRALVLLAKTGAFTLSMGLDTGEALRAGTEAGIFCGATPWPLVEVGLNPKASSNETEVLLDGC